jgi:hypothetical protein
MASNRGIKALLNANDSYLHERLQVCNSGSRAEAFYLRQNELIAEGFMAWPDFIGW